MSRISRKPDLGLVGRRLKLSNHQNAPIMSPVFLSLYRHLTSKGQEIADLKVSAKCVAPEFGNL
jgi:hypothetical protein